MEACFSIIDASRTNRRSTHPQECKRDSESIIDFAQYTTAFSNPSLSSDQRTLSGWFNTAAFAITPQDQLGDAPRASLFGPGQNNFDLSIQRILPDQGTVPIQASRGHVQRLQSPAVEQSEHQHHEPGIRVGYVGPWAAHHRRVGSHHLVDRSSRLHRELRAGPCRPDSRRVCPARQNRPGSWGFRSRYSSNSLHGAGTLRGVRRPPLRSPHRSLRKASGRRVLLPERIHRSRPLGQSAVSARFVKWIVRPCDPVGVAERLRQLQANDASALG